MLSAVQLPAATHASNEVRERGYVHGTRSRGGVSAPPYSSDTRELSLLVRLHLEGALSAQELAGALSLTFRSQPAGGSCEVQLAEALHLAEERAAALGMQLHDSQAECAQLKEQVAHSHRRAATLADTLAKSRAQHATEIAEVLRLAERRAAARERHHEACVTNIRNALCVARAERADALQLATRARQREAELALALAHTQRRLATEWQRTAVLMEDLCARRSHSKCEREKAEQAALAHQQIEHQLSLGQQREAVLADELRSARRCCEAAEERASTLLLELEVQGCVATAADGPLPADSAREVARQCDVHVPCSPPTTPEAAADGAPPPSATEPTLLSSPCSPPDCSIQRTRDVTPIAPPALLAAAPGRASRALPTVVAAVLVAAHASADGAVATTKRRRRRRAKSRSSAGKALLVDHLCFWVAVFVPRSWAPVCSTSARMVAGVKFTYGMGWLLTMDVIGDFRSKGPDTVDPNPRYPEMGPVWAAVRELRALREAAARLDWDSTPEDTVRWFNRWMVNMSLTINLYERMQIQHHELFLLAGEMGDNSHDIASGIADVLEGRERRLAAGEAA
eukprot:TRINITY_DN33676_c0_g1_i2.p1 TRINITY_DN33676_c0_g1~~TRINITY_DN33676_c0_g1_i2.p1  ORF type:complete len:572 (+),score=111.11 TRINITY_DN33676_c0_g1_i2:80-1795(+)